MQEDFATKAAFKVLEKVGDSMGGLGGMVGLLKDHKGWDPVVPDDLHLAKLPPIAADGTAECWQCKSRFQFADLDIAGTAYVCRPCALRSSRVAAQAQAATVDVDNVKIGRGRWWLFPLFCAGALGVTMALWLA